MTTNEKEETPEEKKQREKEMWQFGFTILIAGLLAPLAIGLGIICMFLAFVSAIDD